MKLIAEKLEKSFSLRKIITGISFTVKKGQSLAITGPNGSGKTTLVRMLCSLTSADKGSVRFEKNGTIYSDLKKYLALVGPYIQLYDELTAFENLQFRSRFLKQKRSDAELYEKIELVGLKGRAHDAVKTFSSGMKQRLKYAFSIVGDPEILILDEPTSNLDASGIEIVYRIMDQQKKTKILLFATNDQQDLKFADEVVNIGA